MKLRLITGLGLALAVASVAYASTVQVTQSGKKFSERRITLQVGDAIEFKNDDKRVHNVHSTTPGHEFDLGAQEPGSQQRHVFSTTGKVKIRCAIHPRMKMTVTIK